MDPAPMDPGSASEAGTQRRRRRRWGRGLLLALFALGVVLGGAAAALLQSRAGQRLVLDVILDRVRGRLAGTLTVSDIRSGSLLGGATLVGVTLDAEGGRPFLVADSVSVRYALLSLLGPVPRVASVTLFTPRIAITRHPGEETANVQKLVLPEGGGGAAGGEGRGVVLGSLRVVGGALEVLTPLEGPPPARVPVVPSPTGEGSLRRLALEGVDLSIGDLRLGPEAGVMLTGQLERLAMEVYLFDTPLRVTDIQGAVRYDADGLTVAEGTFRLPSSPLRGSLSLGPGASPEDGWAFVADLQTEGPAALADLRWLDERLPDGVFRGGIRVAAGGAVDVSLNEVRIELEASRLVLDGGVGFDDGLRLDALEIEASPLALSQLDPWLTEPMPLDGWLSGNLRLSGSLGALSTVGRLTLVPTGLGGGPSTADVRGTLHLLGDRGATNLRAQLDPLNVALVGAFLPSLGLSGGGRATLDLSGRIDAGMRFVADLGHGADSADASRVLLQGSARRGEDRVWVVDVQGDLSPLSLDLLHQVAPAFGAVGGIEGSVRAVGPLSQLRVQGDLTLGGGSASVVGEADLTNWGRAYRLGATADRVLLSGILPMLPDPSVWSGRLELEGSGTVIDSLDLRGDVTATVSRLGGLHLDSVRGTIRLAAGVLTVDTVFGQAGGFEVDGAGEIGVGEGATGQVRLAFSTPDLIGLRPLLLGDTVMARDTLSVLERQLLRLQGVDADTLPLLEEVAVSGALDGTVEFTGNLSRLGVRGAVRLRNGVYGADSVGYADVEVVADDVTGPGRRADVKLDARNLVAFERSVSQFEADVNIDGRSGEGRIVAVQSGGDRIEVAGGFSLDSLARAGVVRLDEAMVDLDSLAWRLDHGTLIRWDSASLTLDGVEITREGPEAMKILADGTLSWLGESDLSVEADGVYLDRIARLLQREELGIAGTLDLAARVSGPAANPTIQGDFRIVEPRYEELALGMVVGDWRYADQSARISLGVLDGGKRVLRAGGAVPIDLSFRPQGRRAVQRSMEVRVEADSVDAALVLSPLGFLENVRGVVSGDFQIRGPVDAPEPSGVLTMSDAAWTMEALGVRHSGIAGSLTLNPDRTVDVLVDGRAGGSAQIRGQVVLDPLNDPRLDLGIAFRGFEAVSRRDLAGIMSGDIRLLGSYRAPRVEGALRVDQGTLFLEEFARSTEVVDLTDPRIFQVVDTTALATRPLLAGIRNPFLQNLRVDVDLAVPRDTWLRSADMNVEIGGELLVRYDRLNRDVVMVGELQALRGSYTVLGRRFDVQGGSVGFIGTPGVNPTLDIQAMTRIRRVGGDPLDVNATVEGTLTQPRVSLSSEEQGVAESDLVSYLIFGRPSYELATGQEALLRGAAGSGVTFVTGTLAARLGAALSQEIGIDYLSITQAGDFGVTSGTLSGALAGTQVEVGQYLGDDVFFVLIFRPLSNQTAGQSFFGGARVEWSLTDDYNAQGFWEDRFLRSRVGGFGDLGVQASQVIGIFLFREWGY